MGERTPVSAYRLLSSPCDKSIVFISSRGSPCMLSSYIFQVNNSKNKLGLSWANLSTAKASYLQGDPRKTDKNYALIVWAIKQPIS